MTLITYCIVSKKYTLNTYFLFSLKKHTLFLDFCCFWHPKHVRAARHLPLREKRPFFCVFVLEHDMHLWIQVAPRGRPPFQASPVIHKGPISSKWVHKPPFEKIFQIFSLFSLNFCPNFSSQLLKPLPKIGWVPCPRLTPGPEGNYF